jgi:hypothetical protein
MEHELIAKIDDALKAATELLPNSREKSLVITKLDEARLWAQEALSRAQRQVG